MPELPPVTSTFLPASPRRSFVLGWLLVWIAMPLLSLRRCPWGVVPPARDALQAQATGQPARLPGSLAGDGRARAGGVRGRVGGDVRDRRGTSGPTLGFGVVGVGVCPCGALR